MVTIQAQPATFDRSSAGVFVELSATVCSALERVGRDERRAMLLAAFVVLVHRQEDWTGNPFQVTADGAVRIDLSADPLLSDVCRNVRPAAELDAAWRDLFALSAEADGLPAGCDFAVRVDLHGAAIGLYWHFNAALFERLTIERLGAQYVQLLAGSIADPHRPISRLPLMTAQERLRVLDFGRGKHTRYGRNGTIHGRFTQQAHATPQAIAVRANDAQLTYDDIERRANQLANYLLSLDVKSGMAIGVAFERSWQLPITLLAILKAGALYVPLDTSYPRERIEFMLADANVRWVIACDELCDRWPLAAAPIVSLSASAATIAAMSDAVPDIVIPAESLAYIMYTSGSTGRPKAVAIPHRGVMRLVRGADYVDIIPADVFLTLAPLAFDASTFELWAPLLNGAQLAIPRPGLLSMDDIGREVERYAVSTLFLTTSLFGRLTDSELPAFHRLRRLLTGGEVASAAHMRRFLQTYPGCRLAAVYGPTENTTFSTWCDLPSAAAIGTNVPIGRPLANTTAYVLDRHLEPVPLGSVGELCVGGDGIAYGYLHAAGKTAEAFVADPFSDCASAKLYRTGDRARFRADGMLEFHGRSDDQVKVRGFRIELGEIEAVLNALSDVAEAAVVAVESDAGEKTLVAFVVRVAGQHIAESALRNQLREKLPPYMVPHRLVMVAALPFQRSGKIDRAALARESHAQHTTARLPLRSAAAILDTTVENTIAQMWMDLLHGPSAPADDVNFFDAGGDSLRLLNLLALLNARYALELDVVDLFEHTTIAAQAILIKQCLAK